jgi:predicted DNA-binding antitoxin AbrB/MazE fold protein
VFEVATIEADFEGGVLRPTKPLALRQGERVRLIVVRRSDPARWDLDRLAQGADEDLALAEAGLGAWADALDERDRA